MCMYLFAFSLLHSRCNIGPPTKDTLLSPIRNNLPSDTLSPPLPKVTQKTFITDRRRRPLTPPSYTCKSKQTTTGRHNGKRRRVSQSSFFGFVPLSLFSPSSIRQGRKETRERKRERPNELQAAGGGEEGFTLNTAVLFKKIGTQL